MNLRKAMVAGLALGLALAGCSEELDGPAPFIESPAAGEPLPADPGIVCSAQLTTEVLLSGTGFSPIAFDIPDAPKAGLPEVVMVHARQLDGGELAGDEVVFGGEPGEVNAQLLRWASQSLMGLTIQPSMTLADGSEGQLPDGVYDIRITNKNGKHVLSEKALAVVDKPTFASITPPIVCLAERDRTVTIDGARLLNIEFFNPTMLVEGTSDEFEVTGLEDCTAVDHPGLVAETCNRGVLTLPRDSVEVGYPALTVRNPETAACVSEDTINLRVVPPPTLDRVDPPMVCAVEGEREVTLEGTGILTIDGVLPAATLDGEPIEVKSAGGCEDLETMTLDVQSCTSLVVVIPQEDTQAPRNPELVITNPDPAGCSGSNAVALALVPDPDIQDIQPPALCDDGVDQTLVLTGEYFLTVDGTLPTITVDDVALPVDVTSVDGCTEIEEVPELTVMACTQATIVVNPDDVEGEGATIALENPMPAGCSDTWDLEIPLVDPPMVTGAEPDLVCTEDGDQPITLTGTGFLRIPPGPDGVLPTVTLDGADVQVDGIAGCTTTTIGPVDVDECTTLNVTAAQGSLAGGIVDIGVFNPPPIACSSTTGEEPLLSVPPAPSITSVEPNSICTLAGDQTVTITGTGFLRVDGVDPTLRLNGDEFAIETLSGCEPLPTGSAEACTTMTVFIAAGSLSQGDVEVVIENPPGDESTCGTTATGVFFIVPEPEIAAVVPSDFCSDLGETLVITGSNFTPAATVTLSGPEGTFEPSSLTFVDDTTLEATFDPGVSPGIYDVTVSNAEGCDDTEPAAVEVHPNPLVFFVDPPVLYQGATIQVTIFTSGLQAEAAEVVLIGPSDQEEVLVGTPKAGDPNRIVADVPAGLEAGLWSVRVTSDVGCVGQLDDGVTITDDLSVTLDSVDPSFAWTGRSTAVTIKGSGAGFVSTPRAYLNPNPAGAGVQASAMRAVVFVDGATLTAVVPAGLDPGAYDLIVVNPDASVGLAESAITVTADPPPVVFSMEPASLDTNEAQVATLNGEGFDTAGVVLDVTCRLPDGTIGTEPATVVGGTLTETSVDAAFPSDMFPAGSVCTVTLTNGDGTSFRYSAFSLKTPAQNLNEWVPASDMVEARRGLALAAGRPTFTSRFVYAIGGDDGDVANAKPTVEAASVDFFGDMGAWKTLPGALPAGRTFTRALTLGRYVYLVGGHDGSAAQSSVWRAQLLDPLATPDIVDLDLELDEETGQGVGPGLWFYRVSAVFPADDPGNPSGESLPGEVLVVQLPDIAGLQLVLTWDAIPGASGYRVYRTASADLNADQVELLAELEGNGATTFTDVGGEVTPGTIPLPPGALGEWHPVAAMNVEREGLGVAVAPDPDDAGAWFLYAFGGRDATGAPRGDYEFARVTVAEPGAAKGTEVQTVEAWTNGSAPFGVPRADLGVFQVDEVDLAAVLPGQTWLFVGPGDTGGGNVARDVDAAPVGPDGDLGTFIATDNINGDRAGYGYGDANGFLFIFGAAGPAPGDDGISGRLCNAGDSGCNAAPAEPPDIKNWNSLGVSMSTPRIYMATTQESAFFFVAGGDDGSGATVSVDTTVQ